MHEASKGQPDTDDPRMEGPSATGGRAIPIEDSPGCGKIPSRIATNHASGMQARRLECLPRSNVTTTHAGRIGGQPAEPSRGDQIVDGCGRYSHRETAPLAQDEMREVLTEWQAVRRLDK